MIAKAEPDYVVDLPWPARVLHPNSRTHWGTKASATKKARISAGLAALAAGVRKLEAPALHVTAVFTPPDARHRDTDGMLSSVKASFDGLADVIGVDDSKWELAIRREPPRKPGSVRLEIREIAA